MPFCGFALPRVQQQPEVLIFAVVRIFPNQCSKCVTEAAAQVKESDGAGPKFLPTPSLFGATANCIALDLPVFSLFLPSPSEKHSDVTALTGGKIIEPRPFRPRKADENEPPQRLVVAESPCLTWFRADPCFAPAGFLSFPARSREPNPSRHLPKRSSRPGGRSSASKMRQCGSDSFFGREKNSQE